MSLRKIKDIVNDLKALFVSSGKYKTVRIATVTSYKQLLNAVPSLTLCPAAVICVGPGEFGPGMATREPELGVAVIDQFISDVGDKTESVLDALENAVDLVSPGQVEGQPARPLEINGVSYSATAFRPLELNTSQSAYLLQITAHQRR